MISKDFGSVDGYERHIVTRHPNLPGYPGPADIKFYGLERQDMWKKRILNGNNLIGSLQIFIMN